MNSLLLISPDQAWGFKPILSGKLLLEKIGVTISRATMGRMTQRLDMTFKKKRSFRRVKAVKDFKTCDLISGSKLTS
ncbi:hypothetical protein QUA40_10535 [Microcoleus sp. Pol11C3]|uniref:hypothetical protein n=1 Tax=Microcoleus sp. Pol11C3 TaxID=3055390 RepID=UPI002FD11A29